MDMIEVERFFGTKYKMALALGVNLANVYTAAWSERPPLCRQWQIELLTGGVLKADSFHSKKTQRDIYESSENSENRASGTE